MSEARNNWLLAGASVLLSVLLFSAAYEAIEYYRYSRWRAAFASSPEWFRGLTIPSSDAVLLWEYRPYGEYVHAAPAPPYTLRTNRYGFRDRDYSVKAKPKGIFRIAFIGDSVTFGLKVEEERTFVRLVDQDIRARKAKEGFEALNFGIDGYNTVQLHALLRTKVVGFEPDEVIYVMCLNDFDFEDASGEKIRYFRRPVSFLLSRLRDARKSLSRLDYHEYHFSRNKHIVFDEIHAMKRSLDALGIGFRVVVVPVFFMRAPSFASYPLDYIHREIAERLSAQGIPVMDMLYYFRRSGLPPKEFAHDVWHPNDRGHRLIADELSRLIMPPGDARRSERREVTGPPAK